MDKQSMDSDLERQTPHGHGESEIPLENKCKSSKCHFILFLIFVAATACIAVPLTYYTVVDARYSVGIESATVLDDNMGVSFNLTLVVASRSHGTKACIDPGMFVDVFYRGVPVAASDAAETTRTCARPRNVAALPIVATTTRVPVLDNLAEEMGQGAAVFDLRLHGPAMSHSHNGESCTASWFSDCKGSRVGDAAMPCGSPYYTTQCIHS